MRASAFFAVAFATLTLAAPQPSPDLLGFMFGATAQVTNNKVAIAINDVTESVQQLNVAIRAVKAGSLADLAAVAKQGQIVGQVLKQSQAEIEAAPQVDAAAAVLVQNSARMLAISINNVATSLIQKKKIVQKAGLTASVVQMLENQATANNVLTKSVQEKLPTVLQQNQVGQDGIVVAQSLNRVVMAYSDGVAATGTAAHRVPRPTGAAPIAKPPKRPAPLSATAHKNGTTIATAPKNSTLPAASEGSRTVGTIEPAAEQPKAVVPASQAPKAAAPEPQTAASANINGNTNASLNGSTAATKPAVAAAANSADEKSGAVGTTSSTGKTTGTVNAASVSVR